MHEYSDGVKKETKCNILHWATNTTLYKSNSYRSNSHIYLRLRSPFITWAINDDRTEDITVLETYFWATYLIKTDQIYIFVEQMIPWLLVILLYTRISWCLSTKNKALETTSVRCVQRTCSGTLTRTCIDTQTLI